MTDLRKFENTISFVITRHPFTRIVSAYRNKFQIDTRGSGSLNAIFIRDIVLTVRGKWNEGDPDPSFEEFVKYLIKTKVERYNEHWQLMSHICR